MHESLHKIYSSQTNNYSLKILKGVFHFEEPGQNLPVIIEYVI